MHEHAKWADVQEKTKNRKKIATSRNLLDKIFNTQTNPVA